MKILKTGDPCPCCGKPLKWKNERILQLITYAHAGMLTEKGLEELLREIKREESCGEV